jgi:predicted nucleic acid-binding protein
MTAYVDSSVVLRVVLQQPTPLVEWRAIDRGVSSRLTRAECLRTLDRAFQQGRLSAADLSSRRGLALSILDTLDLIEVTAGVLGRVEDPFPSPLRTLAAIHLASALAFRTTAHDLVFATHDTELAQAATALGFAVIGA